MSGKPYILYGWHLSYFTGKVLCYLRHKGVPFVHQPVNFYTLTVTIRRETGEVVMPAVQTPEGKWLQDSSVIIDDMEARFPERTVNPSSPVQRFVSYLFEAWGDEWWIPIAMHTRWTYPENYAAFEGEAGKALLPRLPAFMQRAAVARFAGTLRSYLPGVGVRPEQYALMDKWTDAMLDLLEAHFAQHDFLLGGRPSLGDYGLVGTMYGHLGRDPWPARELIAPRPHLRAWIDRLADPAQPMRPLGNWLPDDAIAPTLLPIVQQLFAEFTTMLSAIKDQLSALPDERKWASRLPRQLGEIAIPTAYGPFRRKALPYSLWMGQRVLDTYRALDETGRSAVSDWAAENGGSAFLQLDIPRLDRVGLRVALTH